MSQANEAAVTSMRSIDMLSRLRNLGWVLPLVVGVLAVGCGARDPSTPTVPTVVHVDELRITARATSGGFELEAYDAKTLFRRGARLASENRCADAVAHYVRLADEFPESPYASPSLYNSGLCLQQSGSLAEAVPLYERILREMPRSHDVRDASFQLAMLLVELQRFERALEVADRLLQGDGLRPPERVEAMARRAQALFGLERTDDAGDQAEAALRYFRTRRDEERIDDTYFVAAASFVGAEVTRARSEAIAIPEGRVDEQHAVLEQRAELLLQAQREYFDTIRFGEPQWAAAAGYRIGAMYDGLWQAIMTAPVPPPRSVMTPEELEMYQDEYHLALARLAKPLIRHSIRYWELTLLMVERTGVRSGWTDRIREDLDRARDRLSEQPAGLGGLPGTDGTSAPPAGTAATGTPDHG